MTQLQEIMEFNKRFVENKDYIPYQTDKFPSRQIVVLSCMDTRLSELLLKSMNLRNGDAKVIKTAGAMISHPFGSVMRSVLVAVYELKAKEVYIIGHHECGMINMQSDGILKKMVDRGINESTFPILTHSGVELEKWLKGFQSVEESVEGTVSLVKNHPLFPDDVPVHGLVIDPNNGKLDVVVE